MEKKIGISLRVIKTENYNETRDGLDQKWITKIEKINQYWMTYLICFKLFLLSGGIRRATASAI